MTKLVSIYTLMLCQSYIFIVHEKRTMGEFKIPFMSLQLFALVILGV